MAVGATEAQSQESETAKSLPDRVAYLHSEVGPDAYCEHAMKPRSIAHISGIWIATSLSLIFVLTQATYWHSIKSAIVSLALWTSFGVAVDVWSRGLPVDTDPVRRRRNNNRTISALCYSAILFAILWTIFRPSPQAEDRAYWPFLHPFLETVEIAIPGLIAAKTLLLAAHRPDVAIYFEAYQAFSTIGWAVSVTIVARLLSTSPIGVASTRRMARIAERRAHQGRVTRMMYAIICWYLFFLLFVASLAVWKQELIDTDRLVSNTLHNAITAVGSYFPSIIILMVCAPVLGYAAVCWRAALRSMDSTPTTG